MTWTPARAPAPQRVPWSALTASCCVIQSTAGGPFPAAGQCAQGHTASALPAAWAATGYPATWGAIGPISSHAMNVCAPGAMTGGETKSTWFSNVQHFSIFRDKYSAVFAGHNTMRFFVIQTNQRSIILLSLSAWTAALVFVFTQQAGSSDPSMGQCAVVLEILEMLTDAIPSVYALTVAISRIDCWFWFSHFSARHLLHEVPAAWRLSAYCCG